MRFSANILHCRQGDKGDGRNTLQIHIVNSMAHVQILHLEGVANVVVDKGPNQVGDDE